jgi:hypothetical protein
MLLEVQELGKVRLILVFMDRRVRHRLLDRAEVAVQTGMVAEERVFLMVLAVVLAEVAGLPLVLEVVGLVLI